MKIAMGRAHDRELRSKFSAAESAPSQNIQVVDDDDEEEGNMFAVFSFMPLVIAPAHTHFLSLTTVYY